MAHDIQYLFDNITSKGNRSLDVVSKDIEDLEYLMSIDNRKIALANMHKKKLKLERELETAKKKIESEVRKQI